MQPKESKAYEESNSASLEGRDAPTGKYDQ